MFYAHVTIGIADQVGQPPDLVFQDGRWYDLRPMDPKTLAAVGWFPVTEAERPADTALTTWEVTYAPGEGVVVQSWVEKDKSPEQLEAEAEGANQRTIEEALDAALVTIQAVIDQTNADLRADPSQEIKDIARAVRRLIRLATPGNLDGTT